MAKIDIDGLVQERRNSILVWYYRRGKKLFTENIMVPICKELPVSCKIP